MSKNSSTSKRDDFLWNLQKDAINKIKAEKRYKRMEYAIEDAVSEMIMRFLKKAETKEIHKPTAWIVKGAHNILVSLYRKYISSLEYAKATQRGNQHFYDPYETQPDTSRTVGLLKKYIHTLSPRCKQVIELYLEGKKTKEIAREMKITEGSVRSHKMHARRQIFQYLQNIAASRKHKK